MYANHLYLHLQYVCLCVYQQVLYPRIRNTHKLNRCPTDRSLTISISFLLFSGTYIRISQCGQRNKIYSILCGYCIYKKTSLLLCCFVFRFHFIFVTFRCDLKLKAERPRLGLCRTRQAMCFFMAFVQWAELILQ